jgi:hypothetical protein
LASKITAKAVAQLPQGSIVIAGRSVGTYNPSNRATVTLAVVALQGYITSKQLGYTSPAAPGLKGTVAYYNRTTVRLPDATVATKHGENAIVVNSGPTDGMGWFSSLLASHKCSVESCGTCAAQKAIAIAPNAMPQPVSPIRKGANGGTYNAAAQSPESELPKRVRKPSEKPIEAPVAYLAMSALPDGKAPQGYTLYVPPVQCDADIALSVAGAYSNDRAGKAALQAARQTVTTWLTDNAVPMASD